MHGTHDIKHPFTSSSPPPPPPQTIQVIEHMQISLQEKFAFRDLDLGHGLSIVFKLPNGDKVEHNFLLEESIKVRKLLLAIFYSLCMTSTPAFSQSTACEAVVHTKDPLRRPLTGHVHRSG